MFLFCNLLINMLMTLCCFWMLNFKMVHYRQFAASVLSPGDWAEEHGRSVPPSRTHLQRQVSVSVHSWADRRSGFINNSRKKEKVAAMLCPWVLSWTESGFPPQLVPHVQITSRSKNKDGEQNSSQQTKWWRLDGFTLAPDLNLQDVNPLKLPSDSKSVSFVDISCINCNLRDCCRRKAHYSNRWLAEIRVTL